MGAFGLKKEVVSHGVQVFQKVFETAQGGFSLDASALILESILLAGTVIGYDESTRKAVVLKHATLQASASNTDTVYRVLKGHQLKVGENYGAIKGAKAYAITAIDTTNADYDSVTLGTTLGAALATGTALFQSSAAGASAAAFITQPKGLLYRDYPVRTNEDIAVVTRGTIYARRAPTVAADVQAALPLIFFSQSF